MKKWRLFPRSLRQLVMLAFTLVLLPLLLLAYQAWQSLDRLSERAADINRSTLSDARRTESMSSVALEMERSYRQYCVLDDQTLATLYQNQRRQYAQLLSAHGNPPSEQRYILRLQDLLERLDRLECANNSPNDAASESLKAFSRANGDLVQATRNSIYSRGQQLQAALAERGRFFGWQALILFLVSLILVLLFTRMIIGPVKTVEKMINRIGEGRPLDSRISFTGPREIHSLVQRILWLNERLSWLESQRHEFLRHISHELKTPLASLREGTALLADEIAGPLSADQREVVAILDSSGRHLQQLIEQLLDYNRKLADSPAEFADINLPEMIDSVIAAHSLPARAKGMHTLIELESAHCRAQPVLLMRVLDNLYSNAVHYGQESGNIWIRSRRAGQRLILELANSGEPIPAAEQNMIFEPFYQGRVQRKGAVKGSGLGLSIARDCIRRMNGELRLATVDYAAVCFRIELPLTVENASQ
ncbi:sensor histidine kinase [Martelella alba]|uniref:histidine kinase n=1 Tax=Martelella alba TaxID=2590451 RepID=A0ABY2SLW0_9HYPH|nr:HAMP domain-containing sensor histidine kinase [Martelella alba]TKI06764.1 HAMP domain-containing histidine kinase [Martelella alba]